MSWLSRAINAGVTYQNTADEVADGLFINMGDRRAKQSQFWVQLILASVIAAGGVIADATPAVIGAMIIAPLATPIYGTALAAVVGSRRGLRGALLLLVVGVAVNIAIGALVGYLSTPRMPLDANPQVIGRTSPTVLDLTIAVATGIAGAFALVRRDVINILAGVAIAISLVPVLAVVGITLGAGRLDLAVGAFVLFLANAAAILISGVVVFGAAGYYLRVADADRHVGRRAKVFIITLVVVLLVPLGYMSWLTAQYGHWSTEVKAATTAWVSGTPWTVDSVAVEGDTIVASIIGSGALPPLDELRAAVRGTVPEVVPVLLLREYGAENHL
jgi:uncharacterized hydrophobic protein (TIGR00271 family)